MIVYDGIMDILTVIMAGQNDNPSFFNDKSIYIIWIKSSCVVVILVDRSKWYLPHLKIEKFLLSSKSIGWAQRKVVVYVNTNK